MTCLHAGTGQQAAVDWCSLTARVQVAAAACSSAGWVEWLDEHRQVIVCRYNVIKVDATPRVQIELGLRVGRTSLSELPHGSQASAPLHARPHATAARGRCVRSPRCGRSA